jgi:hypothetical protein
MVFCNQCGKEAQEGETYCRHCGAKLPLPQAGGPGEIEGDLAAFIGKNADSYLGKFTNFRRDGETVFAVTWHWPAFFVTFFWLLYRKMYGWAVLAFFLGLIPYVGLISHIVFAMTANYLYYQHAGKRLLELKSRSSSGGLRSSDLAREGGVNNAALAVAVALVFVATIGIIAAIAIPQFASYKNRAYDLMAKHEVQSACSRCTAILSAHPEKMEIVPEDLLSTGFSPSPDIDLMLLDGRRETFGLSARHLRGNKTYVTDRECRLTEELQEAL